MSVTPDTGGKHVDIFGSSKPEGSYVGDILYSEIQLRVASQGPKWTPPWTQSESCWIMSGSLQPHGQYSPWTSPGQNTGMGSLSLLQGNLPTQGSNPGLLHWRWILCQLSHQGSPRILEWVAYPFSRGSSQPRNRTGVSCTAGGFFTNCVIRETHGHKGAHQYSPCFFLCPWTFYTLGSLSLLKKILLQQSRWCSRKCLSTLDSLVSWTKLSFRSCPHWVRETEVGAWVSVSSSSGSRYPTF